MDRLREQLRSLDGTQEDIEQISRAASGLAASDVPDFVELWLENVSENRTDALVYMYVANDIVQKCRGTPLWSAFKRKLPQAIDLMKNDALNRPKFIRILNIWTRRKVFDTPFIMTLKKRLSQASLNTEFGELPEFQEIKDNESDGVGSGDDDHDEDYFDDDKEVRNNHPLKRESSMTTIQRVPTSRLLTLFKQAKTEAEKKSSNVLDLAEKSMSQLRKLAKDSDAKDQTESERLKKALEGLPDSDFHDLEDMTMTALQTLVSNREAVRRAGLLASALVMSIEVQMESVGKAINDADVQLETIQSIEKRVSDLEKSHTGELPKVEAVLTTYRRRLRASAQQKKRARMMSDEAESSDESGSDYEYEDEDEDDKNGKPGETSEEAKISVLGIRKRKRRKKKKVEEESEESVPMIWNKQLNMYVPMPNNLEEEDWRN